MNLPEPVAWYYTRDTDVGISFAPDRDTEKYWQKLFTEYQLREALARQEAVMTQALEALKRMERYGNTFLYRRDEQNPHEQTCEAIKALKEALK